MYDSLFSSYRGERIKGYTELSTLAEHPQWLDAVHLLFNIYQYVTDIYNTDASPVGIKEVSQRFSREYSQVRRTLGCTETFTNFIKLMIHGGAPFYIYFVGKQRKSYILTSAIYKANKIASFTGALAPLDDVLNLKSPAFVLTENTIGKIHEELDLFICEFRNGKFDYSRNLKQYDASQAERDARKAQLDAQLEASSPYKSPEHVGIYNDAEAMPEVETVSNAQSSAPKSPFDLEKPSFLSDSE